MPTDETQLAVITTKLDAVIRDQEDIKRTIQANYVTQDQFKPVKIFVYGLIAICLSAIGVAVIGMVVRK